MTPRASRFFADVDPEAPHPDYPRPQLRRPEWVNLNGRWEFAISGAGEPQPESFPGEILVPFPIGSVLSGVERTLRPDEQAWMRRSFAFDPGSLAGLRLRLHFGAVDWECSVSVNGLEVGSHRGGHTPFHLDITDALRDNTHQEIVLSIHDPSDRGPQPLGKQMLEPLAIWYPAVAGVWQTVWLEPVPEACIESVVATSDLEASAVMVRVEVSGAPSRASALVEAAGVVAETEVVDGIAECRLVIDELRPWSPTDPHLYDLRVSLTGSRGSAGAREAPQAPRDPLDVVESYFGAREVALVRDEEGILRLALNGEVVFHLGPLDQGWWPEGLYTAPTDEALAFDIEATKAMGFNTIRKHVKVEPARWYWHADRLGLLVWQDMPSTAVDLAEMGKAMADGIEHPDMDWAKVGPARDPAGFRLELDEMIDALEPFPSIVVWVPFNEGWGQHDTASTIEHLRGRDSTRLVDGPSGWVDSGEGDLRDHHMYFKEAEWPGVDPERAVVYGEFGGFTFAVDGHRLDLPVFGYTPTGSEAELAEKYDELMATLADLVPRGLAAAIYTQTTDVEGEINGLLTYDRAVQKLPVELLRELHGRLTGSN